MFRAIISPILRSTRLCLQLVVQCTDEAACRWPGHRHAASSVHYTTSCKHSPVLQMMGEIIARNMLSWLNLLINLTLLRLVGCLYYYIKDARSHKHQFLRLCSHEIQISKYFEMKWNRMLSVPLVITVNVRYSFFYTFFKIIFFFLEE